LYLREQGTMENWAKSERFRAWPLPYKALQTTALGRSARISKK